MNEIKVNVSFEKRVLNTEGINAVTGDYNSTKIIFEFDKEYEGRKVFEIAKPYDKDEAGQAIFVKEIENNEVTLVAYDENGKEVSIFSVEGRHPFEISLYNGNSKLTSMYGILGVSKEAVKVGDEVVERYIPIFDDLMNKANTIIDNLEASEKDIQDAEATRNENEEARIKAEVIRSVNEDNRKAAEENRSKAETDRATSEETRVQNEETRQENETSRVNSETARNKAETSRSEAEQTRDDNETTRTQNEESRVKAEADRGIAEEAREDSEKARVEAEKNRATAETKRAEDETSRADAEEARNEAETTRVNAEKIRDEAETTRNESETTRNNNETAREEAETIRNENESTRIANEIMRQEKFRMIDKVLKDITVEGSNIHIKDSAYWHAKVGVCGKSEQETRSGRNLYNFKDTTQVSSGVTVDEDGWITITCDNAEGTAVKYLQYFTNNLNLKNNTNYNIIYEIKNVSGTGWLALASTLGTTEGQMSKTIGAFFYNLTSNSIALQTVQTRADLTNYINGLRTFASFQPGESGSITFRISVLEDTTITADTFEYEQYGAMPSFLFPSPIKSVTGDIENKFYNKNELSLIDQEATSKSTTITIENNIIHDVSHYTETEGYPVAFSLNGTIAKANYPDYLNCNTFRLLAGTYTLSYKYIGGSFSNTNTGDNNRSIGLYIKSSSNKHTELAKISNLQANNREITFTLTEDADVYITYFIYRYSSIDLSNDVYFQVQLERGEVATNCEPHQSQTYPLSLGSTELNGDETVRDRPVKIDGKWFYEFKWKRLILDGTKLHWAYLNGVFWTQSIQDYLTRTEKNICLSTHYKSIKNSWATAHITENNSICFYAGDDVYRMFIKDGRFTNVEDFRAMLAELYANGTPVEVVYKLNKPIYKEITDETLISQLDAMEEKAKTYQTVTNISSDAHLEVTYKKDLQTQINEIDTLKQAIVALGGVI